MKVLKFLILLLISAKSFAQYTPIHTPTIWDMGGFKALFIGDTTFKPTDNTKNWIAIQGTTLYKWNSGAWVAISGGGGGDVTPYVLPQATPLIRGGITYNTDFYIDANGRLAIDTSKKNLWNQIALLPFYSTTAQMRGEIRDTANAHNLTFGSAFSRTGNNIDLIQQPFIEKDSIFTNSPAASLTVGNMGDINAITDTSIHPTTTYVRSLLGKKDTVLFNRAHFYKKSDSTVNLNIRSINGIKLYGDTSNIVIAGGGTAKLPYNGDSSFYFGGDTVLHRLPVAPATSDSIDYAFTAMTTVYNEAGPGEYVSSATGLTANKDNFNFPFRQLKSMDIGAWTDGNYVSFTNATISSSTNFTFLRAFIRLKSALSVSTTISFAFYYNGTLVSKTISCVNYGLDKNKVGVYQNVSIPISAFGFTANNFNELRLKLGGTQSDGIYMDLVQFQNASPFENTFLTDNFKKPGTDSIFNVVGGINVFAYRDNAGATIDTASYLKSSVAASSYFPLQGGAITGTGGNGYVGFIPQSVNPTTPASGFKLFATSPGAFAWLTSQGYARELRVRAQTQNNIYYLQDKSYTLADSADVAGKLNIADTANIRLRATAGTNMTITGTYPNLTFNSTASGSGGITGGSIAWPATIYSTPTTGVVSGGNITFSPSLASQTAYSVFGRGSGSGTPSFLTSLDSNYIPALHSKSYYDGIYPVVSFGKNVSRDSTVIVFANGLRYASKDSVGAGGGGSQWTTVNTNDIYYNTGNVGIGSVNAPVAKLTVNSDNLGVPTSAYTNGNNGISLINNTAATSTVQQYSPVLRFQGQGWKTNATAASQPVDWRVYAAVSAGSANPGSGLFFDASANGGAYTNVFQISSSGTLTVPGVVNAIGNINGSSFVTSSTGQYNVAKAPGTAGTDGMLMNGSVNATSGAPVQYSPRLRQIAEAWDGTQNSYNAFIQEVRPVNGISPTRANLVWAGAVYTGTGTFADKFAISTGGGVILYPMTKAVRDAIPSPEQGRIVFVSDNGGYLSYYNAGWFKVSAVAD